MKLEFYVTINELKKGGRACAPSRERPKERYVKVLSDSAAYARRGCNCVYFKELLLATEMRSGCRNSEEKEPTIGLLDDALAAAKELGVI